MSSNIRPEFADLRELLHKIKYEVKSEINCVSVGRIVTFYPSTQTADISINYKRVLKNRSAVKAGEYTDFMLEYPTLLRCPVMVMNGGGGYISFPITAGDSCIILFNDRDMDLWLEEESVVSAPNTERMHDLSDAIALVGIKSIGSVIQSYDSTSLKVSYKNTTIVIKTNGDLEITGANDISISSGGDINLNASGDVSISGDTITIEGTTAVEINP